MRVPNESASSVAFTNKTHTLCRPNYVSFCFSIFVMFCIEIFHGSHMHVLERVLRVVQLVYDICCVL